MRTDSPITILAGEDLEPNRRVLFNGTNWVYADAYEKHDAVVGESRIVSGRYGFAYAANEDGVVDVTAAGSIAAGAKINGKDDGKCDDDGLGIPLGINNSYATIASGDPCPMLPVVDRRGLLYSATAASAALASLASETAFDKSFTIPANTLKAGDVVDIWAQIDVTAANSTDTFLFKVKVGSSIVAATGTIDAVTGDIAVIHSRVQIRTAGASGTMVASAITSIGTASAAASAADIPSASALASATVDTTAANAVTVTATHSTNNAGNQSTLQMLQVMHHTK